MTSSVAAGASVGAAWAPAFGQPEGGPQLDTRGHINTTSIAEAIRLGCKAMCTVRFPLKTEVIVMKHGEGDIRVRLHGDEVLAMDSFWTRYTYLAPRYQGLLGGANAAARILPTRPLMRPHLRLSVPTVGTIALANGSRTKVRPSPADVPQILLLRLHQVIQHLLRHVHRGHGGLVGHGGEGEVAVGEEGGVYRQLLLGDPEVRHR